MKSFEKIIGYDNVKTELYQILDMIHNKERYEKLGATMPHGLMLYGKPGTGKTLLANAFIEESKLPYVCIRKTKKEDDLIEEIKKQFRNASLEENPFIILLDDMDKYCKGNDCEDAQIFCVIQSCLDTYEDSNIFVIATVNNIKKLPISLKRKGRFDRTIELKQPSFEDASKIIKYYLSAKQVDKNINYDDVAKMIHYSSCAELELIINESALVAGYKKKEFIGIDDIVCAYLNDRYDDFDIEYLSTNAEDDSVSIHEAGHIVVAESIKKGSVGFASVYTASDDSEGFTSIYKPFKRRPENILLALGGKVACELLYEGKCASGCQSDLSNASQLIRDGISRNATLGIGMLDVSTVSFPKNPESFVSRNESVVQAEIERNLFLVRQIILNNKELVLKIASELKTKKYLLYSDIQRIEQDVAIKPSIVI